MKRSSFSAQRNPQPSLEFLGSSSNLKPRVFKTKLNVSDICPAPECHSSWQATNIFLQRDERRPISRDAVSSVSEEVHAVFHHFISRFVSRLRAGLSLLNRLPTRWHCLTCESKSFRLFTCRNVFDRQLAVQH